MSPRIGLALTIVVALTAAPGVLAEHGLVGAKAGDPVGDPAPRHDFLFGSSCGGTAPETTSCTTGRHRYIVNFGDGVACGREFDPHTWNSTGYTGTVESRMIHANGTSILRQHCINGDVIASESFGPRPPFAPLFGSGEFMYVQDCASYVLDSTGIGDPAPGMPGGSGRWECFSSHL